MHPIVIVPPYLFGVFVGAQLKHFKYMNVINPPHLHTSAFNNIKSTQSLPLLSSSLLLLELCVYSGYGINKRGIYAAGQATKYGYHLKEGHISN